MNAALRTIATLMVVMATDAAAEGINLGWDACGAAGGASRVFACDSNLGTEVAIGSFVPPAGVNQLSGIEIAIDVCSQSSRLPAWWQFRNAESCRQYSLGVDFAYEGSDCANYWENAGGASGGLASYRVSAGGSNQARIIAVGAVDMTLVGPVDPKSEYFAFRITIDHASTAGIGACEGCGADMCLVLNRVKLTQPAGVGDFELVLPLRRQIIGWQHPCLDGGCKHDPAKSRTPGRNKSAEH